ncbi:hypothetical protein ElyMa_004884200 [Elysia marginata]|uniref:Uncharacterized protein n=1 Tax=Elysia marginata TaxID=1093978 RepID=A0AAV4IWQ1_9GAST|nr:hypothetical protein ElyMa_004884200 [Elysia marginata]
MGLFQRAQKRAPQRPRQKGKSALLVTFPSVDGVVRKVSRGKPKTTLLGAKLCSQGVVSLSTTPCTDSPNMTVNKPRPLTHMLIICTKPRLVTYTSSPYLHKATPPYTNSSNLHKTTLSGTSSPPLHLVMLP